LSFDALAKLSSFFGERESKAIFQPCAASIYAREHEINGPTPTMIMDLESAILQNEGYWQRACLAGKAEVINFLWCKE
jgi:hypothetical protein